MPAATRKTGTLWIAPTALPLDVSHGPVETTFRIHLKGIGWSETANIYTVVYDNGHSGYACGFNSQGDVEIFMQATGEPGWHFIDLYPAIYKGKETRPVNYRLPELTGAEDHPGEDLPVFHFAFEVTPEARCWVQNSAHSQSRQQCAQVPLISMTDMLGRKPARFAAAARSWPIASVEASPTALQVSQMRKATSAPVS